MPLAHSADIPGADQAEQPRPSEGLYSGPWEDAALVDAGRAGRDDLEFVPLSDPASLKKLEAGDFLIAARGRRYFSNDALLSALKQSATPAFTVSLGQTKAIDVYALDNATLRLLNGLTP